VGRRFGGALSVRLRQNRKRLQGGLIEPFRNAGLIPTRRLCLRSNLLIKHFVRRSWPAHAEIYNRPDVVQPDYCARSSGQRSIWIGHISLPDMIRPPRATAAVFLVARRGRDRRISAALSRTTLVPRATYAIVILAVPILAHLILMLALGIPSPRVRASRPEYWHAIAGQDGLQVVPARLVGGHDRDRGIRRPGRSAIVAAPPSRFGRALATGHDEEVARAVRGRQRTQMAWPTDRRVSGAKTEAGHNALRSQGCVPFSSAAMSPKWPTPALHSGALSKRQSPALCRNHPRTEQSSGRLATI
jgi:hypothetical protein